MISAAVPVAPTTTLVAVAPLVLLTVASATASATASAVLMVAEEAAIAPASTAVRLGMFDQSHPHAFAIW